MECRSCHRPAGFLRRLCDDCACIWRLYERHRGTVGLTQFLDVLLDAGVPRATIEAALESDPDGGGALRDRLTADMANQMLADMGVSTRQTPADVKRLRESGAPSASTTRPTADAKPPPTSRR